MELTETSTMTGQIKVDEKVAATVNMTTNPGLNQYNIYVAVNNKALAEANPELVQAQFDEFMTAAREKLFVLSYQLRV
jgi:ABC-type nitrate/sulfonate/bicarbonate transport system substrate-binding protein